MHVTQKAQGEGIRTAVDVLGIDNVFLEVGDLEEAVMFYRDVVGLSVAKRFDDMGSVLFQIGSETPGLGVTSVSNPRVGGQKLWLEVADARAAATRITATGVVLLAAPLLIPTGWMFEFADPWGNVVGMTDYVARPELGRAASSEPSTSPVSPRVETATQDEAPEQRGGPTRDRQGF